MTARLIGLALLAVGWLTQSAAAHFIWIDMKTAVDESRVEAYFSEQPEPGEAHLIDRIAQLKTWIRTADGQRTDLQLVKPADGTSASLKATCRPNKAACIEATCDYGVYAHDDSGVRLHYYAKHLTADWQAHGDSFTRSLDLACDIVPSLNGKQLKLQVFYLDHPAVNSEVVVIDPAGETRDLKTDAAGCVALEVSRAGRHAIRAARIEPGRSSQHNGKPFDAVWHYCTLTFDVCPAQESVSAAELLQRAREGRSIWKNFPGFSADVAVEGDGPRISGKVTIDGQGGVSLQLPQTPQADWALQQMHTLVQHRMPEGEVVTGKVTFVDEDSPNPQGRLINLGDSESQSRYRIRDDMILEVSRNAGDMRFTISVLEVVRNNPNEYLPRTFAMNFFDLATGDLKSSLTYRNDWQRVGDFDLPSLIVEVGTRKGTSITRQIVFSNARLLDAK